MLRLVLIVEFWVMIVLAVAGTAPPSVTLTDLDKILDCREFLSTARRALLRTGDVYITSPARKDEAGLVSKRESVTLLALSIIVPWGQCRLMS